MRHGSRIAASPPGSGTGSRWARRSNDAEVAAQQLAAPERPVGAVARCRRRRARAPGRSRRARPGRRRRGRGGAGRRRARRPARAPTSSTGTRGAGRGRSTSRLDVEHREVELEIGAERAVGQLGVEVAEMRREERLAAARDAERALQLGADGDDRARRRDRQRQRAGRVAARAADREGGADDRVLAAAVDRPVVGEERVGDPAEPLARLVVVERDRLVGAVAARHHQSGRRSRRAADGAAACTAASRRATGVPGATDGATGASGRRRTSTIGRSRDAEQRRLVRRRRSASALGLAVITANGLSSRCLRARSRATAVLVGGVAGEVVAAEPLDGEDRAVAQELDRRPRAAATSRGPQTGQAIGSAWKRRSPGSSYSRAAVGAQREAGHRRSSAGRTGRRVDDREPRPALRAVDERVAVAAVARVEELAQAVVARGDVRRDQRRAARRLRSRAIAELGLAARRRAADVDGVDARERRRLVAERARRSGRAPARRPRPRSRRRSPSLRTKPPSPCRRASP